MTDDRENQTQAEPKKRRWVEEIEVTGNRLVERVEELLQESSTKRVVIKSQEGKELMSVPLTFGMVAGGILTLGAPLLAALGAAADKDETGRGQQHDRRILLRLKRRPPQAFGEAV